MSRTDLRRPKTGGDRRIDPVAFHGELSETLKGRFVVRAALAKNRRAKIAAHGSAHGSCGREP